MLHHSQSKKNGRNGNDLARRVRKLEAGFNLLIECLGSAPTQILLDTHDDELVRLLKTPGATETSRLCNILRRMASDAKQPPSRRLSAGLLSIAVELRHCIRRPE